MVKIDLKVMVNFDVAGCCTLSNFLWGPLNTLATMHFCSGHQDATNWPPFHFEWTSPLSTSFPNILREMSPVGSREVTVVMATSNQTKFESSLDKTLQYSLQHPSIASIFNILKIYESIPILYATSLNYIYF